MKLFLIFLSALTLAMAKMFDDAQADFQDPSIENSGGYFLDIFSGEGSISGIEWWSKSTYRKVAKKTRDLIARVESMKDLTRDEPEKYLKLLTKVYLQAFTMGNDFVKLVHYAYTQAGASGAEMEKIYSYAVNYLQYLKTHKRYARKYAAEPKAGSQFATTASSFYMEGVIDAMWGQLLPDSELTDAQNLGMAMYFVQNLAWTQLAISQIKGKPYQYHLNQGGEDYLVDS